MGNQYYVICDADDTDQTDLWALFLALEIKFVVVTKHINLIISFKMKSVNPWLIFFFTILPKTKRNYD
jgi:hypothetical protein